MTKIVEGVTVLNNLNNMNDPSHTPALTVRKATMSDLQLLIDLGIRTFHDTFASVNKKEDMDMYMAKSFNTEQLTSELLDDRNTFIIVESGTTPAGYAKVRQSEAPAELADENLVEIERVYAGKEFLGKQVGKFIMDACLDIARQEGFEMVWLGVWEHNERAIAFYEKCGFEIFGKHPFVLGTDHQTDLLFKKKLY
ncbi:MAG: GNAT family N-acetyltransferase [Chryseolinea sp.]